MEEKGCTELDVPEAFPLENANIQCQKEINVT